MCDGPVAEVDATRQGGKVLVRVQPGPLDFDEMCGAFFKCAEVGDED